jgi:hypothetical protein
VTRIERGDRCGRHSGRHDHRPLRRADARRLRPAACPRRARHAGGHHVVATRPLGGTSGAGPRKHRGGDVSFVLDYFRRSADHRLLFGGRVSYSGIDARDRPRDGARMQRVFRNSRGEARLRVGRLRRYPMSRTRLRPHRRQPGGVSGTASLGGMAGRWQRGVTGASGSTCSAGCAPPFPADPGCHTGAGAGDAWFRCATCSKARPPAANNYSRGR